MQCLITHLYFQFQKKGRVYKVGTSLMEIPFHLVDILIGWYTSPRNQEVALDKRFVNSLLMVLVPLKSLATETAPEPVLIFIRSNADFHI